LLSAGGAARSPVRSHPSWLEVKIEPLVCRPG
jgi:hypothetical protein